MQHRGTRYIVPTKCKPHHRKQKEDTTSSMSFLSEWHVAPIYNQQPSAFKRRMMQLQTSKSLYEQIIVRYPHKSTIPQCAKCAEPPSMERCLPPHLAASVDLHQRAAHRSPGNRRQDHDVFLGSLIHQSPHRVTSLEQTCIPISDAEQTCTSISKKRAHLSLIQNKSECECLPQPTNTCVTYCGLKR